MALETCPRYTSAMLPFVCPALLTSARLALRPLVQADAAVLFADYTSDTGIARYLPWRQHQKQHETEAMIDYGEAAASSKLAYLLAIVVREEHEKPIGLLNIGDSDHGVSIGFGLARHSWGNGYGREIVNFVTNWLLNQPEVWRVWGYCDQENDLSAEVMTRAGMQFEGHLRRFAVHPNLSAEPRDCKMFASVRE